MPNLTDQINSDDWLRELARDAANVEAVMMKVDTLLMMAMKNQKAGNITDAQIRISEAREGLRLIAQLTGMKLRTD